MPQQISDLIVAAPRQAGNKGLARRLRRAGRVPAVTYAPGQPQRFLSLDPKLLVMQLRRFSRSHIYRVKVEGGDDFRALIKEIQQDSVSKQLLHVDLAPVDMSRPIKVRVPLELTGKPAGLIEGGLLSQVLRSAEVQCLPDRVPAKLLADVGPLKVGESLHLSDLKLPDGVRLTSHENEAIALVSEPDAAPVETATAAAATPAAAPATPGKPPDKK